MSIFDIYKNANINLKDFLENHYQVEWKKSGAGFKAICPFHIDTKPSLSYNKKNNRFKCMVCDASGDIINYIENIEKVSNIEACKKALILENIYFEDTVDKKELSQEEKENIAKEQKERKEENQKKKEEKRIEEEKEKQLTIEKLTKKASIYAELFDVNLPIINDEFLNIFPNQSAKFYDWKDIYLGYDTEQDSICILNRTHNPNKCFNIKHRFKYSWDENLKSYDTSNRLDGKWISAFNATTFAFPYEYFKQNKDDRVIICEGEKDALNLLSYDINCLTLGGVTNSWNEHKNILKDKIVYIWFDNDEAGYLNALQRYREIEDVAAAVYIVLFFNISNSFPNKYDISDYLSEKKFEDKESIFEAIIFSSFILTNEIIDEVAEHLDIDIKAIDKNNPDRKPIYKISPLKEFKDIRKIFTKTDAEGRAVNIFEAKGELDNKDVDRIISTFKGLKADKNYQDFKDTLLNSMLIGSDDKEKELEKIEKAFTEFANLKQTLITNYRQTHIVDMVNAFNKMANHTGYTFGEYKGMLSIWTGTHFEIIKDVQILKFVINDWFYHAKIDIKKQTEKNALELISNVRAKSLNIDEIKERNQEKRIINLLNGTLIISKKGKTVFKPRHDKLDGSTNILKFNYDEKSSCPKWTKFLDRVLPIKEEQEALMEYIGYCLLPTHAYETFLLLYGKSGANGKSVIMDTISNFFGIENISSLDLQQFYGHELEAIANKFINIGTEIDPRGLDKGQMPMLKKLVSPKDRIPINPKNKSPYQLESFEKPKLVFSTNTKPKQGMDDAVFRRTLLLTFDSEIKDGEKIRDLSDRFKDELGGILNLALEKLQNLIKNGKFTKSKRMIESIEEYKDDINPARRYISENIELDKKVMIPKKFLYYHYKEWADAKGHKSLSEQSFWSRIKEELPQIDTVGIQKVLPYTSQLAGKPRCVEGIYCNSNEVNSFIIDKDEIKTADINLEIKTKAIFEKVKS